METKYTIFLADDHELVAQGLSTLLLQIQTVGKVEVFKNGKELFQACLNTKPDFIFLDYEMPVWDGKETLIQIKKNLPKIPVLMLSMLNEKSIIKECIQLGASAYLHKDSSTEELHEAIESTSRSEIYYSNEVKKALSGAIKNQSGQITLKEEISEREMEILKLLCDGLSPKEISEKLFLSQRTVETHKTNIMHKFDVNSIAKLISIAIKNRIV